MRVGLVGYGLGGAVFHAPVIEAAAGLSLDFIVTGNPGRADAARGRHPGAVILPDADALWERRGDLDAVVITTPNRTHAPLAHAAMDAGLHLVVDKPLAASADDARRLIDHAARAGLVLTVYHNRRWDDDFLTLRRLLDQGALGRVHRFESRLERWRPEPKPGWRESTDPADAGGILYDLGSHLIDQALVLFGPVATVHAEVDTRRPGATADDDAFVALHHRSGVRSHLWMSALAAEPGPRMRALGDRGGWVRQEADPQEAALRERGEAGRYTRFYEGFLAAIRDGAPPPVDPRDALEGLLILEAARRSAEGGVVVEMGGA